MQQTVPTDFDVLICGAGPVGLATAALMVQFGAAPQRIALVDARSADESVRDPRSIALSFGSRQILERVGAWPLQADAIHQIHVSRRGHFGRALIECDDYRLPALGYVTRYGTLVTALAEAAERSGAVAIRPVRIDALTEQADAVAVQLADGRCLRAGIVVQAEGGVFAEQTARTQHRDYEQVALVSHVRTSTALPHRAFERFTSEGPLALLPQDGGYALVWCMRPASAERVQNLDDAAFLQELQTAFGDRLGRFLSIEKRHAYPLGLNARPAAATRMVAIGNAAQTLHPVAGQGLNLGLRDARVLARLLARRADPAALQEFSSQRQADRRATITLTDVMARIFAATPDHAPSQSLLGLSLGLIDTVAPARRLLAQQMMFGWR
ncbi:UbiH/UbiF/VisC/COQ6 family ubiquinone biosynthesis hydroxylase [Herbaspirillum sp. RTI4]|uniref:UbiH/UbiF/VisC/COQ6 family ubiquinone biosynthesis hydroxylase n=1 Tax=Herbaspirillum sp. RTI4 TaxID=3048640 RepID=UPI002AB3644B|nr:UbiH/UbiF/VisC/COQ6 family ubiquinone biosynthesis hydroxylase [Herbaspirillum sp. RTI4]MDY7576769.1 UbiH/UbiF/VisC/COQ6 family ubiquinone biosynthesis hydroxylase [Herbaspirillum sp. RTI4]MEA9981365.1 UbiH/UbiF/VisC/COQ6 family ubiquinone biosynthesis hydroxylase [Herbaspirillum sp. RTI4]